MNSRHSMASSVSSKISTYEITNIIDELQHNQHRDSTKKNYLAVWRVFNEFFIWLDNKPSNWEDRLTLFVGYLVQNNKQSSTVKSYISAIKAVLNMNNIRITEDQYQLAAIIKACWLRHDCIQTRLPIRSGMLSILLSRLSVKFSDQPFLAILFRTLFSTMYFGLFRISEVKAGNHQLLAKDVFIAENKKKFLFVLCSSKTHWKNMSPQQIKISSTRTKRKNGKAKDDYVKLPCPYDLLRTYDS